MSFITRRVVAAVRALGPALFGARIFTTPSTPRRSPGRQPDAAQLDCCKAPVMMCPLSNGRGVILIQVSELEFLPTNRRPRTLDDTLRGKSPIGKSPSGRGKPRDKGIAMGLRFETCPLQGPHFAIFFHLFLSIFIYTLRFIKILKFLCD